MNARHVFAAACCLALGIAIGQISPTPGQQAVPQAAVPGHYQMTVTVAPGIPRTIYMCDTTTGHYWYKGLDGDKWTHVRSPAAK
jgi:hypothetical protein